VTDVDRDARARSFGALADAYHRHRPGYPGAALDWAFAPLRPEPAPVVLDLAAGTGKLTESLVERALGEVYAVEPDPEMLAVLRVALPVVKALPGSAEAIPLPDASVDAVLVGQAFHWFDPEPATAEIARVLRPGGVVALLWNGEDLSVDWVGGYYALVRGAEATGTAGGGKPASERTGLDVHPSFKGFETRVFANPLPVTIDGLLDNLGTFSWISTLQPAERDSTIAAAREYLAARPETAGGAFELPLRTIVVRAVCIG
jgi:SAM-dependent methyltransferase